MSGSGSAEKIAGSKAISKNTITKRVSNILVGESNKRYLYSHLNLTACVCAYAIQCKEIHVIHAYKTRLYYVEHKTRIL